MTLTARAGAAAEPGDDLGRQQRVAAEVEEVVVDADRGRPRTSAQIAATTVSVGGGRRRAGRRRGRATGAGRARRSSLPFGPSAAARRARRTRPGPCSRAAAASAARRRRVAARGRRPRYATSRWSPGRSSRTMTAASRTPGCSRSAASISPSSIRRPRSLTWWSMRPRNSSVPSGRQRARSPVRYSRAPGAPNGSGTNRRRSAGPVAGSRGRADAADVQLAGHPDGHRPAAGRRARTARMFGDRARRSAPGARRRAPRRCTAQAVTSTAASVGPYRLCSSAPGSAARQRAGQVGRAGLAAADDARAGCAHAVRRRPRRGTRRASTARSATVVTPSRGDQVAQVGGVRWPPGRRGPGARRSAAARRTPRPTRRSRPGSSAAPRRSRVEAGSVRCIQSSRLTMPRWALARPWAAGRAGGVDDVGGVGGRGAVRRRGARVPAASSRVVEAAGRARRPAPAGRSTGSARRAGRRRRA